MRPLRAPDNVGSATRPFGCFAFPVMNSPQPNDLLAGDFCPDPVRVLTVQPLGNSTKLEAVGTHTQ